MLPTCRTRCRRRSAAIALTQVLQDEQRYDLVLRYLPQFRNQKEAIENIRLLSPSGERVSLAQLCDIETRDGASEIYREANQRYVAIKYSVRGRDLGGAVEEAIKKVSTQVKLPAGYHIDWAGEYESQQRAPEDSPSLSAHADADLPDPVFDVQVDEVVDADFDERRDGAGGGLLALWLTGRTSVCPRASASSRCSVCPCRSA